MKLKYIELYEKPPLEERNPSLFYFDCRTGDDYFGFDIEKNVVVNHEGSIVCNMDILQGREFITDDDFYAMNPIEVDDIEELTIDIV